jgi:hypothetical protein
MAGNNGRDAPHQGDLFAALGGFGERVEPRLCLRGW